AVLVRVRRRVVVAAGVAGQGAVLGELGRDRRAVERRGHGVRLADRRRLPGAHERRLLEPQQLLAVGVGEHELAAVGAPPGHGAGRFAELDLDLLRGALAAHERRRGRADLELVAVDLVGRRIAVATARTRYMAVLEEHRGRDVLPAFGLQAL